jgi:ornithine--oxo-acid transaminase
MKGPIDLAGILARSSAGGCLGLRDHLHPSLARLLEMLGFDHAFVRGEGAHLWLKDGTRILDCLAGFGAHLLGRGHPVVREALHQCLASDPPGWVRMSPNGLASEAARLLKERSGRPEDLVYFANSGTEGVEAAIKLARRHTSKAGIAGWVDGFHGFTMGALSVSGIDSLKQGFGDLLPHCHSVPFGDLEAMERLLEGGSIAAVIIEPIQGKTLRCLSMSDMQSLHAMCRRSGALLIADEVQTGLGRTGSFLALARDQVEADIVVLSKGLSGGFVPMGAVLVRPQIWRSTFSGMERSFVHSSTHHEGPLAMVAAIATLEALTSERLVERSMEIGEGILVSLRESLAGCAAVREVRGRGMMIGVEIDPARVPSLRDIPWVGDWTAPMVGQSLVMDLFQRERVLGQVTESRRPVLKLLPPLCIAKEDATALCEAVPRSIQRLSEGSTLKAVVVAASRLMKSGILGMAGG